MHLGHPLIFNHQDRDKAYDFILNKFQAKLIMVKAGRLTYINSILASILIYYMSTILFEKTFMDKITAIIRQFWWAGVQEDKPTSSSPFTLGKIFVNLSKLGGLGIKDLHTVNKSLILHAVLPLPKTSTSQLF
jgi:hypothetical protein